MNGQKEIGVRFLIAKLHFAKRFSLPFSKIIAIKTFSLDRSLFEMYLYTLIGALC